MPVVSPLENTDIVEGRGCKVSREQATVKTEKEDPSNRRQEDWQRKGKKWWKPMEREFQEV